MISFIWGQDRNRLIGCNNALPWKLPADMAWFKKNTMGKPILMGRKTYESIGLPLPERTNLILTRQPCLQIEGCTVVHSLDEAKSAVPESNEIMVIGGSEIYTLLFDQVERLYITEIDAEFEGDAWFPTFDKNQWREVFHESHPTANSNLYPYAFIILERRS